jgi:hypothetical protein
MERMHLSAYLAIPMELAAMLAMGAALGATLSLTLKLGTPDLNTAPNPDLKTFVMLLPLSIGYVITAGTGVFVLLTTLILSVIHTCHRSRGSKACSFEPTASSLGMSHGYQASMPVVSNGRIPTFYDPNKPVPNPDESAHIGDEEKGFASAGADMGRRDSAQDVRLADDKEISRPLALQKPEEMAQLQSARPARPWSEIPKRR